jgi:hypothetical protein
MKAKGVMPRFRSADLIDEARDPHAQSRQVRSSPTAAGAGLVVGIRKLRSCGLPEYAVWRRPFEKRGRFLPGNWFCRTRPILG